MSKILVVGNPSLDQIDNVYYGAGGPVSYISNILSSYSHNVTMFSSFADDFPIESLNPKINLIKNISKNTTKFILSYKNNLRELKIFSEATKLNLRNLKKSINKYDVVFFAPVFHEIDINEVNQLVNCNDKYFVSVPQGWIRIKNKKKILINFNRLKFLPKLEMIFFSEEEIQSSNLNINDLKNLAKILVITRGHIGSTIFYQEQRFNFSSYHVKSIDTTGAGDIYAAVFAITFFLTKELIYSANLASKIASESTKYWGMEGIFEKISH
jgi:sugar/nucleoside kinase (ribokinase family)